MTIDEAISHCEEVVERERKRLKFYQEHNMPEYFKSCKECEEEHRQLAEWLRELKFYRTMIPSASEYFRTGEANADEKL